MIFKRNKLYKVYSILSQTPDKEKTLTAAKVGKAYTHITLTGLHLRKAENVEWVLPLPFKTTVIVEFYIQQNLLQKKRMGGF